VSGFNLKASPASVVWVEPHRLTAGGKTLPLDGLPQEDQIAKVLQELPQGATSWVVDDLWAPSVLLRDVVALPTGIEAQEAFFRWKFTSSLALESPYSVQPLALGEGSWLLAGIREDIRDSWLQTALRLGRPVHSLLPRWLHLYNRLAPSQNMPGMLLSLCPHPQGGFTGTLAAWGRTLTLLRQWADPADPATWMQERIAPTAAYMHRESRPPQELWIWGAPSWPESELPHHLLQPEILAQEAL